MVQALDLADMMQSTIDSDDAFNANLAAYGEPPLPDSMSFGDVCDSLGIDEDES